MKILKKNRNSFFVLSIYGLKKVFWRHFDFCVYLIKNVAITCASYSQFSNRCASKCEFCSGNIGRDMNYEENGVQANVQKLSNVKLYLWSNSKPTYNYMHSFLMPSFYYILKKNTKFWYFVSRFLHSIILLIIWQDSPCSTHCNVKIKLNDMKKQSDMIMMSKVKNMDDNSQTLLCKILIS